MTADRPEQSGSTISDLLLDIMEEGVIGVSGEGLCVFANHAASQILGDGSPMTLKGMHIREFIPEGFGSGSSARARLSTPDLDSHAGTLTFRRTDGSPVKLRYYAQRLDAPHGYCDRLLVFTRATENGETSRALREAEEKYRGLYQAMRDGCASFDADGRIVKFNQRFKEILGYDEAGCWTLCYDDILAERSRETDSRVKATELADRHYSSPYEVEYRRKDASIVPIELQTYVRLDRDRRPAGFWVIARDITKRKIKDLELLKLSYVIEQNSAIVVITDTKGRIEYANPKFEESSGFSAEDAVGKTPSILKSGEMQPEVYKELWNTLRSGKEWRGNLQNRRKDGSLYWEDARIYPLRDPGGNITHYVAIKEDITERKAIQERLHHQIKHDDLTGLPNRTLAFDLLTERIDRAIQDGSRFGLLVVNIDGFSRINSEIGQEAGDDVLSEVARRLEDAALQNLSLIARLGGDRFLVGIDGFRSTASLEVAARAILALIHEPFPTEQGKVTLSGTIGIAVFPNDGNTVETLLRNAEAAVRQAKSIGRNTYRFFIAGKGSDRSLRMESLMQTALERNELYLEYQPIMNAYDHRCTGAEALIRWKSPEVGFVSPNEFVPLFEEAELAHTIGRWVLQEAVARAGEWNRQSGNDNFMSVNVSPRQLRRAEFVDLVADTLNEHNLPPECLKLEITERLFIESRPEVLAVLEALNELGVILTLDDFGTGYSALGSLHKLPIRCLKIDRSFVESIDRDSRESAIVQAINNLCEHLGIVTVAEGIETRRQAEMLAEIGCDYLQGYYFSRSLSWDALMRAGFASIQHLPTE